MELKDLQIEILHELGKGAYGTAYLAKAKSMNKFIVLKELTDISNDDGISHSMIREISILKSMNHKYVIKLLDVIYTSESVYLVFDYYSNGDLQQFLKRESDVQIHTTPQHRKPTPVQKIMYQLLSAVSYIHGRGILHRDIKPGNIFLDKNADLVLADFGLSRAVDVKKKRLSLEAVTLGYRCPEILLGDNTYSTACDMWSVGCVFAEVLLLYNVFSGESCIDLIFSIFQMFGSPSETNWPEGTKLPYFCDFWPKWNQTNKLLYTLRDQDPTAVDLLQRMLVLDPAKRISAKNALKHKFFEGFY